jgi:hypothetical protein
MNKKLRLYSVLGMALAILCVGTLVPVTANAQVTINHILVTETSNSASGSYCDTAYKAANPSLCDLGVWTFPGGSVTLAVGETLVLTQTGTFENTTDPACKGSCIEPNFDTSEIVNTGTPVGANCSFTVNAPAGQACTVVIKLDTGAGLVKVYGPAGPNSIAIDDFNLDNTGGTPEGHNWETTNGFPVSGNGFTLTDGYADNEHGSSTFPVPFNGTTNPAGKKNTFIGKPVNSLVAAGNDCLSSAIGCFDAGAILITGATAANPITVTQGGWGAPPHGGNPGAFLVKNFGAGKPLTSVTIGQLCVPSPPVGQTMTFTTQSQIQSFLPQGGPPGAFPSAGVFAGQVLALELNVSFSDLGLLGSGLGGVIITPPGLSVSQILADANKALGGCGLPGYVSSISQLNDIVNGINEMFDH